VRKAAQKLGLDPSAANYAGLAREHVVAGNIQEVLRVCTEGLEIFPDNAELKRLAHRARQLQLDTRLRTLHRDLLISPRPALWRELIELYLESSKLNKAEESAEDWYKQTKDGEAIYFRARVRGELFFTNRRAQDGRLAYDLAEQSLKEMHNDPRPLQLQFEITRRSGAWQEARTIVARLLELMPGNPELESRFRAVQANCEDSLPLDRALAQVERTGNFVDDLQRGKGSPTSGAVRPMLQELGMEEGVRAAVYLRGGTALVQGPHGPTADRTARMVRELLHAARGGARRLSLGQPLELLLEGDFGTLQLTPGDQGAAALWLQGAVKPAQQKILTALAAIEGATA
jgi:tetratricopeptide (TPR) repeat protein